jgi:zinc transport system substrate-binding protein
MRRIVPFFSFVLLLLALLSGSLAMATSYAQPFEDAQEKKLHVLSTIKPIQAIVMAIAGERVRSTYFIPAYASPHNYSFKPSDIRLIKQADVIFRIDDNFEVLLNTHFAKAALTSPVIALADSGNIKLLDLVGIHNHTVKTQKKPSEASHANEHDQPSHLNHQKHHSNKDLHIWASPQNIQSMATMITETLSRFNVKNAEYYHINLSLFIAELDQVTEEIEAELAPFKKQPFVVFHNSWQYFLTQFGLQKPTVIDFHEGLSAGIKSIRKVRKTIASNNIHCVFSDPSIQPKRVYTLTEDMNINTESIDISRADLAMNKEMPLALLKDLSHKIKSCLTPKP